MLASSKKSAATSTNLCKKLTVELINKKGQKINATNKIPSLFIDIGRINELDGTEVWMGMRNLERASWVRYGRSQYKHRIAIHSEDEGKFESSSIL